MKQRPLTRHLIAPFLLSALMVAGVLGWIAAGMLRRAQAEQSRGDLEVMARLLAGEAAPYFSPPQPDRLDSLARRLAGSPRHQVTFILPGGRVAGYSHSPAAAL